MQDSSSPVSPWLFQADAGNVINLPFVPLYSHLLLQSCCLSRVPKWREVQ